MKIIHCADLHLDSKMTTNLSKEQAKERKMEILRTFSRMVDFAAQNQVSVILIAGDMFDTRNISVGTRNLVYDTILKYPKIDFLYLKGNHDYDNFISKLEEIPKNLKLFSDTWTSYEYGNVVFTGLEITADNQAVMYPSLVLDHNKFNIVTLHGQVGGDILLPELSGKNIDYLALGHVHTFQMDSFDARGTYCYSGALEGRGFDECGDKGFVLVEIDEEHRKGNYTFVPFASRNLYTLEVDVSKAYTTQAAVELVGAAIANCPYPSKSMVKIVLTGAIHVDAEIHTAYIEDQFTDYFYYEKVKDETTIHIDYSQYEKDASLKGEFIRLVMNSDMDEQKKSQVIRLGIMALSGEEV